VSAASAEVRRRASAHLLLDGVELASVEDVVGVADDVAHHLRRVLRLADGDPVTVTDGAGHWRSTTLRSLGGAAVLEPISEVAFEDRPGGELALATAIPKGERIEWLIQKVAELGADRVVLLHTARSVVRWRPDRADRQRERLQRIADEALRQSRRVWRTVVEGPVEAATILPGAVVAEPGGRPPGAADQLIAVGPEGGWTADELARAGDRIGLGDDVLRVETAAIAAVTLVRAARRGSVA
jgi:16S rRNA (uracil1498-N3)-methyltransferase